MIKDKMEEREIILKIWDWLKKWLPKNEKWVKKTVLQMNKRKKMYSIMTQLPDQHSHHLESLLVAQLGFCQKLLTESFWLPSPHVLFSSIWPFFTNNILNHVGAKLP